MKLHSWITDNKFTLASFAKEAGTSHAQISRILNGKRRPSWKLALRIQAATGGEVPASEWEPDIEQDVKKTEAA